MLRILSFNLNKKENGDEEVDTLFAEVIDELKEYKYLIMKKARKIKEFKSVLKYFGVSNKDSLKNLDVIKNIISRYDLVWKEFKKETS